MKSILTLLSIFSMLLSYAQESSVAIENIEMNVLYRGYENKIKVGMPTSEDGTLFLTGSNVTITRKGDFFIVKPGVGKTAELQVIETKSDGTQIFVGSKEYRVAILPTPVLHWGSIPAGKAIMNEMPVLSAGYGRSHPFNHQFRIVKWYADYDGKEYSADGTDISDLSNLVSTFTELTEITISAYVNGGDGITRKIDGTWFVRPSSE
ncbi:MAG: hypothetical protein ACFHU9_03555 [Fluviicola sp.]